MSSHPQQSNSSDMTSIVLAIALPALFLWVAWTAGSAVFLKLTFVICEWQFWLYTKLPLFFPEERLSSMNEYALHLQHMNPKDYGFSMFVELWVLAAYGLRIPFIALIVFWLFKLRAKRSPFYYVRKLTRDALVRSMVNTYPNLKPIVGEEIHTLPLYSGPWRVADSYISFACRHQLLLYKLCEVTPRRPWSARELDLPLKKKRASLPNRQYLSLNKPAADQLFQTNLGKPWRGFDALPPHWQALAGVFAAKVSGGNARKAADDVLLKIALSYSRSGDATCDGGQTFTLDTAPGINLLNQWKEHEDVKAVVDSHAFESTVLMGLLEAARKKGKLPCSNFIWLRPIDRRLWYTLIQVGGRAAMAEGAGAWAHFKAECYLKQALPVPSVEAATDALEDGLILEDWISQSEDVQMLIGGSA